MEQVPVIYDHGIFISAKGEQKVGDKAFQQFEGLIPGDGPDQSVGFDLPDGRYLAGFRPKGEST